MNQTNFKTPLPNGEGLGVRLPLLLLLFFLCCGSMRAQYATVFYLTDLDNATLKTKVQQNISKLLTEFNTAEAERRMPDFAGINISYPVQMCIEQLWKNAPFRTGDSEIVERCLHTYDNGYQVRNIQLFMQGEEDKPVYQEAVIGFNADATITDFHLAIDNNLYVKVLKKGWDVTDLRYRQMILDYVEQFRTAYNTKDMDFLQQVYSDDALIITGRVIKTAPTEMNNFLPKEKVVYTQKNKKQYLTDLEKVFKSNKRIHVVFDDIKIMRHPAKEGYYGVTLKQGYSADRYSDSGYLFLLWDFNNPEAAQIHVRTWQPEELSKGVKLPEEEIFTCDDFDIM